MHIAFFGSSLLSSYWNGAATYYRGIIKALAQRGHSITFYEPNAYGRQAHLDLQPPAWATVKIYEPDDALGLRRLLKQAGEWADILIKTSGIGVLDDELAEAVLDYATSDCRVIYWDVDAPATLAGMRHHPQAPLRALIPDYDAIFTYGGGDPIRQAYGEEFKARHVEVVYNAVDPETHHPTEADPAYACDLVFLGNRLPDREQRVEEFFLRVAESLPDYRFLLGGNGWEDKHMPRNIRILGHVPTRAHNALNASACAVLNISRSDMAATGWSPATRVFEVAGSGSCLITDAWRGIDCFLQPEHEVLVASSGADVAAHLQGLNSERAKRIGQAGLERVLREHTYKHRAEQVEACLDTLFVDDTIQLSEPAEDSITEITQR